MIVAWSTPAIRSWLAKVFGEASTTDVEERGLRFGEESLELIQSLGIDREQALALVKQVYDKPVGDPMQELGGVMVTLASLVTVADMNAGHAFETEWGRVQSDAVIKKIKAKHDGKLVVSAKHEEERTVRGASLFDRDPDPIYPDNYAAAGRSVKRSHRAEGRNFID